MILQQLIRQTSVLPSLEDETAEFGAVTLVHVFFPAQNRKYFVTRVPSRPWKSVRLLS
jgi:hypothetical protein